MHNLKLPLLTIGVTLNHAFNERKKAVFRVHPQRSCKLGERRSPAKKLNGNAVPPRSPTIWPLNNSRQTRQSPLAVFISNNFYRASECITCRARYFTVSFCLSVLPSYCGSVSKRRQTSSSFPPCGRSIILVFLSQCRYEITRGPQRGR